MGGQGDFEEDRRSLLQALQYPLLSARELHPLRRKEPVETEELHELSQLDYLHPRPMKKVKAEEQMLWSLREWK